MSQREKDRYQENAQLNQGVLIIVGLAAILAAGIYLILHGLG